MLINVMYICSVNESDSRNILVFILNRLKCKIAKIQFRMSRTSLIHIHVYVHCIIVGTTYANYRIFVSGNEKEISMIFCLVFVG